MAYSMAGQFKCDALASWVPRLVPQYVHDTVSNASHLPAVNYLGRSFRWKSKRSSEAKYKLNSRDILYIRRRKRLLILETGKKMKFSSRVLLVVLAGPESEFCVVLRLNKA